MSSSRGHRDAELETTIRRDLVFLFRDWAATVSSNTREAFGNSEVTIGVQNLEFQFLKNNRDNEFRVAVAPRSGHGVWELIHVALAASTGESAATLKAPILYHDNPASLSYIGLTNLASVLEPRFERLNRAFAPENYPNTHSRMVEIERLIHP